MLKKLIGMLFIMIGATFVIGSWGAYFVDTRIQREGVTAKAKIIQKYVVQDSEYGNEYVSKYEFSLPSGKTITGRSVDRKEKWEAFKKGDFLEVKYLPADPARNFPAGKGNTSLGLSVFCSLMGVFAVFLGLLLLSFKKSAPKEEFVHPMG